MAVFRPDFRLFHNVDDFVQRDFDMRFRDKGITHRDFRLRARVNGQDTVVLLQFLCKRDEFVRFAVHAGFVHKAETSAERAVFHCLVDELHFFVDLFFRERFRVKARNAYARRAVSDKGDDIDVKFAFGIFNKVFETAGVFGVE